MNFIKNMWDKASLFISGWKVHLAAFATVIVNVYDAVATYWDWSKLFSDPLELMIFNSTMAVLIMIFRQMTNTANALKLNA